MGEMWCREGHVLSVAHRRTLGCQAEWQGVRTVEHWAVRRTVARRPRRHSIVRVFTHAPAADDDAQGLDFGLWYISRTVVNLQPQPLGSSFRVRKLTLSDP